MVISRQEIDRSDDEQTDADDGIDIEKGDIESGQVVGPDQEMLVAK
jgi:hypothetical protein